MINTFVSSSNIQRLGWKAKTLFIQFNSGDVYSYDDVDFKTFVDLTEAESVGSHFHRHIRSRYNYEKLHTNPFMSGNFDSGLPYTGDLKKTIDVNTHH